MRTISRLALHALVGATAAAMTATLALAAPAQAADPVDRTSPVSETVTIATLEEAVKLLEPHVSRSESDGTFVLDAPTRLIERIGPDTHQVVLAGMAFVNGMIRSGALVSTSDLRAVPKSSVDSGGIVPLHHGVNSFDCNWFYCTLSLDRGNTTDLVALLGFGVGVAGLVAFLCAIFGGGSCSAYAGAAAAILTIGASVIELCANSHGVWIRFGVASWCGGQ